MKIATVEAIGLKAPTSSARGYAQRIGSGRVGYLVKITTDDGIVGWGQCGGPAQESVKPVLELEVAPLLIGRDPFLVEDLWQRVVGSFSPYGIQGLVFQALSGVDIALWDIKARALDMPLWRLFGAKYRDRVLAYASGPYYFADEVVPDQAVEEALTYRGQGYKAMKIKIGGMHPKDDVRRVEAIRRAVGDDVALMVDANQAYNAPMAMRVGQLLEPLDLHWFEEPVPCTDLDGYARLRSVLRIPIAGGEVEWTRFGVRDMITRGAVDVIQPDLANAGGFTECRRIAALADAFGVQYMPHVVSSTPIGLAAGLHLLATLRDFPTNRAPTPLGQAPALEFHRTPNPLRDELCATPFDAIDGYVEIPNGPELGIEIDEAAVKRFRVD